MLYLTKWLTIYLEILQISFFLNSELKLPCKKGKTTFRCFIFICIDSFCLGFKEWNDAARQHKRMEELMRKRARSKQLLLLCIFRTQIWVGFCSKWKKWTCWNGKVWKWFSHWIPILLSIAHNSAKAFRKDTNRSQKHLHRTHSAQTPFRNIYPSENGLFECAKAHS